MSIASPSADDILALLRDQSDEHKLAALILLAKYAVTDADTDTCLPRAFELVGAKFLVRLLRTPGSMQADVPALSFERVALRASATFCTAPTVAKRRRFDRVGCGIDAMDRSNDVENRRILGRR
jgi:hypothetical protein